MLLCAAGITANQQDVLPPDAAPRAQGSVLAGIAEPAQGEAEMESHFRSTQREK